MVLLDVIDQELIDTSRLMAHANAVGTRAKTVYYKAIYNGLAAVVEAIMYMIVKDSCAKNPALLENPKKTIDRRVHDLNPSQLGSSMRLFISERTEQPFTLADVSKQFADMNKFCRQQSLISERLYKRIDRIRDKRNHVHLQLRTTVSRSYTKSHINSVADTIAELYGIWLAI